MSQTIGRLTPIKAALGRWLTQFHAQFMPDTPANQEWAQRQSHQAMAFAPARMVDQVEAMLSTWKRNDNGGYTTSAFLPVLFAAVAPDYTETPGEHGRPLTDWLPFSFPDDTLKRSFRVRLVHGDLRAQVVVVSSDVLTTMSIIAQLIHWGTERQTFYAPFEFAGFITHWPVKLVQAERMAIPTPLGEQVSVLSLDLTLRISLPSFRSAEREQFNDGHEPPGFPVVTSVDTGVGSAHDMTMGPPTGVSAEEWSAFAARVRWSDGPAQVGLSALGVEA
jgi:hypothetical protein